MRQSKLNLESKIKKIKNSSKSGIETFYRDNTNVMLTFSPVQKQLDGHNCGLFAVTFAAEILDGKSPIQAVFQILQLHSHLVYCLKSGALTAFIKI